MPFMQRTAGILFVTLLFTVASRAQDTLPRFSVAAKGTGRILVSWHNLYPTVSQISIQRSTDSLKNFTTLLTVPDPSLPENGAMDNKVPHPNYYYRLFIVLDNGKYLFSRSRRPQSNTGEVQPAVAAEAAAVGDAGDSSNTEGPKIADPKKTNARIVFREPPANPEMYKVKPQVNTPEIEVNTVVFIRKGDSLIGQIPGGRIGSYRDSLLKNTKDTLVFIDGDTLVIKPFVPKEIYKVSPNVFVARFGNIHIALPDAADKHYNIKFFDDNNKLLFELSEIKDPSLTLDKTNFHHSGWFHFELYDGARLKEKNKFFIPL
jgi:hypothetical protein